MLKLSIITVNLNNSAGLQKTIESVISQTFTNFEYIIIDGGSIDGSKQVIEKYADKITYWVSEKDKGIYNGMNKGIKVAKGEYCLFLNSGDWLINNEILQIAFNLNFEEGIVYGNILLDNKLKKYQNTLDIMTFVKKTIPHPASFIKRILFEKYGLYNEKNKIVSDWEFFMQVIIKNNCSYRHIELAISNFDSTGISGQEKYKLLQLEERQAVLSEYTPLIIDKYILIDKQLKEYRKSKIIQFIKKIQQSKLYRKLRGKR